MSIKTKTSNELLLINFEEEKRSEISLFDFSGNCLRKTTTNYESTVKLSLKGVTNGVYILQVDGFFQKIYVS